MCSPNLAKLFKGIQKTNISKKDSLKNERRRTRLSKVTVILYGYDWLQADKDQIFRMICEAGLKESVALIETNWIMRNLEQIIDVYCDLNKIKRRRLITDSWQITMDVE